MKLQSYVSGCYGSLTSFNVLFAARRISSREAGATRPNRHVAATLLADRRQFLSPFSERDFTRRAVGGRKASQKFVDRADVLRRSCARTTPTASASRHAGARPP